MSSASPALPHTAATPTLQEVADREELDRLRVALDDADEAVKMAERAWAAAERTAKAAAVAYFRANERARSTGRPPVVSGCPDGCICGGSGRHG